MVRRNEPRGRFATLGSEDPFGVEHGTRIRLATTDDAAACLAIYRRIVEQTAISFEVNPPTLAEMETRILKALAHSAWIVSEDDDGVTGYAYGSQYRARAAYDWTAETSVYIHERCRGQGIGHTLCGALLHALRIEGYRTAIAGATLPNAASAALHESLGFRPAGHVRDAGYKFDRWHDVGFWQVSLGPGTAPRRPMAAAELAANPEWQALLAGLETDARSI